jgi:hypothetical protein
MACSGSEKAIEVDSMTCVTGTFGAVEPFTRPGPSKGGCGMVAGGSIRVDVCEIDGIADVALETKSARVSMGLVSTARSNSRRAASFLSSATVITLSVRSTSIALVDPDGSDGGGGWRGEEGPAPLRLEGPALADSAIF